MPVQRYNHLKHSKFSAFIFADLRAFHHIFLLLGAAGIIEVGFSEVAEVPDLVPAILAEASQLSKLFGVCCARSSQSFAAPVIYWSGLKSTVSCS